MGQHESSRDRNWKHASMDAVMAVCRTRRAAEAFVKQDPFILEGLIMSFEIRDWGDQLLT